MRFASTYIGRGGDPVPTSANVDPDYPLTNLHDGTPTEVTRWTTNAATRIVWDAGGSPVFTLEGFLIVMHTWIAGSTVKLQANDTNVWTSPAFEQT